MTSYPSLTDYQAALAHPAHVFADPELQACRAVPGPLGLPRVISGGFALTFRLRAAASRQEWAVRCFQTAAPDRADRYQVLSAYLRKEPLGCLVPFVYQPEGILLPRGRFPIVKMAWVQGQTLGAYIEQHHGDVERMQAVLASFRALAAELERRRIAHGDLDDSNILVSDGPAPTLRLVDYDGMYVPGMPLGHSRELGHTNYQSALRDEATAGPLVDRFSILVIALALEALTLRRDLWRRYAQSGENLLFVQKDFREPEASPLLQELRALPALAQRVEQFTLLCRAPLECLPSLADFTSGKARVSADVARAVPHRGRPQYPIVDARQRAALLDLVGQRVQVVGQVVTTKLCDGQRPYAFLNFGRWQDGAFYLVLWAQMLERLAEQGQPVASFAGSWVSATGLVQEFRDRDGRRKPQIVLEDARHMRRLTGAKEAQALLGETTHGSTTGPTPQPVQAAPPRTLAARPGTALPARTRGGGRPTAAAPARPTAPAPADLASRNQAALAAISRLASPAGPAPLPGPPAGLPGTLPPRRLAAPPRAPAHPGHAVAPFVQARQAAAMNAASPEVQRDPLREQSRRGAPPAPLVALLTGGVAVLMAILGAPLTLLLTLTLGLAALLLVWHVLVRPR